MLLEADTLTRYCCPGFRFSSRAMVTLPVREENRDELREQIGAKLEERTVQMYKYEDESLCSIVA